MEGMMRFIMGLLAMVVGIYSLLIIVRIILTWFGHTSYSKPAQVLSKVTDPYLDWWRIKLKLKAGSLDLSPIAALAALSVVQTICSTIASRGEISLGIVLTVCLLAIWSAASFILGFCFIVLVLRLIAYLFNSNITSMFWRVIDSISQPLMYHINRIIFGKRIVRFTTGIITSIVVIVVLWIGGKIIVQIVTNLLNPPIMPSPLM